MIPEQIAYKEWVSYFYKTKGDLYETEKRSHCCK